MNPKLSQDRFWLCHENRLIKTISMIPRIQYVSFKQTSLFCGLRDSPGLSQSTVMGSQLETHIQVVGYRLNHLDDPIFKVGPKPILTAIHRRLESCDPPILSKGRIHPYLSTYLCTYFSSKCVTITNMPGRCQFSLSVTVFF